MILLGGLAVAGPGESPEAARMKALANEIQVLRSAEKGRSDQVESLRGKVLAQSSNQSDQASALAELRNDQKELRGGTSTSTWIAGIGAFLSVLGALATGYAAWWTHDKQITWDKRKIRHQIFSSEQDRRLGVLRKVPALLDAVQIAASTYLAEERTLTVYKDNRWNNPEEQAKRRNDARKSYLSSAADLDELLQSYGNIPLAIVSNERDLGTWSRERFRQIDTLLQTWGKVQLGDEDQSIDKERQESFRTFRTFIANIQRAEEQALLNADPTNDGLSPFRN